MKSVKLGIIGLGYVGQIHLRHCLKLSSAQVYAVSDLSKKSLAKARNAGVRKVFSNYKDLLADSEIDAVIISLPTHLHLECAREAAEAKKHILLEKPMARNAEEAEQIVSSADKNSVKLMIGYPMRFSTEFRNLREEIKQGKLGDVKVAYASYIGSGPFFHRAEGYDPTPVPEWWFNKKLTGGGALIDIGVHLINLLRWYFGEIKDIKAHFEHRFGMDFEDSAICLIKFQTGTTAIVNVGWFSSQYHLIVEVLGSVGHSVVQHRPTNPLSTAAQMLTTGISKFFHPHFSELQYFVNCLIKDVAPSPSGLDGLKDLEAIGNAYNNEIQLE